jgi:hypothetical protein
VQVGFPFKALRRTTRLDTNSSASVPMVFDECEVRDYSRLCMLSVEHLDLVPLRSLALAWSLLRMPDITRERDIWWV